MSNINPVMDSTGYQRRKAERVRRARILEGVKMEICAACSGSGAYDVWGSPPCSGCDGKGKSLPYDVVKQLRDY